MNHHKRTKTAATLNALLCGERLTSLDAMHRFGTIRLASIIHQLRRGGVIIETFMIETHDDDGEITRYGEYVIPANYLENMREIFNKT